MVNEPYKKRNVLLMPYFSVFLPKIFLMTKFVPGDTIKPWKGTLSKMPKHR